jgi:hypothetical protein
MLRYFKRLIKSYRLWRIERELRVLEKHGDKNDPTLQELIRSVRQMVAEERAASEPTAQ